MSKVQSAHLQLQTAVAAESVREKADLIVSEIDDQIFLSEDTAELLAIHNEMIREASGSDAHWVTE